MNAAQISKLCDDWCAVSVTPEGGIGIGANTERFRLLNNGAVFHELSYEALCAAVIGTCKVLLRPGFNAVIDYDHYWLWSWCGELLLGRYSPFPAEQHEIKSLYSAAVRAGLAPCSKPATSREEARAKFELGKQQPRNISGLLMASAEILTHLSFPLLEALLKRACSAYVAFDGAVVAAFSVPSFGGGARNYNPVGGYRERQCSSLHDLLLLHRSNVASAELGSLIDQFRQHISALDNRQDPFDLIYAWRNQSLHGSASIQTIGGAVFSYCLLVSLDGLRGNYERHRSAAVENVRRNAEMGSNAFWIYYPPY